MALTYDVKLVPQIWDIDKSAEEMIQICKDWLISNKDTLTDAKMDQYNSYVSQLTSMIGTQINKVDGFFAAREAAYKAFEDQKAIERQALADLWQTAEDNDHTIPV